MLDLKIVGGTIVDGTGRAGYRGDVGVKDGRIVSVGKVDEPATKTVDAKGRIVSPGFIDVHTHYDAQVFWDPALSPSCFHGVTTAIGGFCGFSIAPITPDSVKYLAPMLARVEGMPLETLQTAVPWNWSSFGEYLSRVDGNVGLNVGFFAGHSAIRRMVMGTRAVGEKATSDEVTQMQALLDQSLREGALGFSTTVSPTHSDGDGNPVPSRWADKSEIIELARVVSRHEGTGLELLPNLDFPEGTEDLLADFSIAGQRPVNWNVLVVMGGPTMMDKINRQLKASDYARSKGGEVIALTIPTTPRPYMNLHTGHSFDMLPGLWREVFKVPVPERIEKFKDPALRKKMVEDGARIDPNAVYAPMANLGGYTIISVHTPENKRHEGRKVRDVAAERGVSDIDAMFDLAIADKLETVFSPELAGNDHATFELRGRLWNDDRILIGASDAGAHLDILDAFSFSTTLLETGVREHKVISLEQAVHKITQRPATYFGLIDRGTIAPGNHADLVVFDADTVGRERTYARHDLPGGNGHRLYAEAIGIDHVFVNGVETVTGGKHTGALPGKVFRSGKDTRTVAMNALRAAP